MPWVRPYVRSDGTPVRGHSRWAPGARREMTVLAVIGLAVVGFGNGNASGAADTRTPRPQPTTSYPIRFDNAPNLRIKKPEPTVSYPIRFPSPKGHR